MTNSFISYFDRHTLCHGKVVIQVTLSGVWLTQLYDAPDHSTSFTAF
jgi:hypothetical protein